MHTATTLLAHLLADGFRGTLEHRCGLQACMWGYRRRVRPAAILEVSKVADDKSGPSEGVKGVVEGVKGKAKEAVGAVTGNDDLTREGRAQQDKAESQREVAKKEAEAEKARGKAAADEARQRAEQ